MKLLVLADLHLGASLAAWGSQAAAARDDLARAWDEAVELALDARDGIDGLLVAGDLFDAPEPPAEILDAVDRGLGRLVSAGKQVVLLPGIYDGLVSPRSVYHRKSWPSGVLVVDWSRPRIATIRRGEETLLLFTFAPLPLAGQPPFAPPERKPEDGAEYRVGLFHAVPGAESPLVSWGCRPDPDALAELCLDLLVMGGDHRGREAIWGRTRVLSPGSPVPLRPQDHEETAWTVVTLSGRNVVLERRPRGSTLDPAREIPAGESARGSARGSAGQDRPPVGGLRAALLRVYEERLGTGEDRALLESALRYGLEKIDRPEACHVD